MQNHHIATNASRRPPAAVGRRVSATLLAVLATTALTAARCGVDPDLGAKDSDMNAGARSYRTGREPAPAAVEPDQVKHDDKDVPPAPSATSEPGAVEAVPGTTPETTPGGVTPPPPMTPPVQPGSGPSPQATP
jgi:hypothetical protein